MATTKTAKCENCCPQGGAIFEADWDFDQEDSYLNHPIWRCRNCWHVTKRLVAKPVDRSFEAEFDSLETARPHLKPAQIKSVEGMLRAIVKHHSLGNPEKHEFKRVAISIKYGMVFLLTDYGMVGDEGTMASVLCRDHRHFKIGTNGGIELINAKCTRTYGYRAAWALTK